MQLEICVDSVESAMAAERGGAQRVELCSDLLEDGITPSHGLVTQARRQIAIDLFVMIRPRGGDFCYTDQEFAAMEADIVHARELGADGIVLGVLDEQDEVDVGRTRYLVQKAAPLPVTFHRAIDSTPDPCTALEAVIRTGAQRVLTSGGAAKVTQGLAVVAQMVTVAANRIRVMAGGGVTAQTLVRVAQATAATEFHASLRMHRSTPVRYRRQEGFKEEVQDRSDRRYPVREEDVRSLALAMQQLGKERRPARTHARSGG